MTSNPSSDGEIRSSVQRISGYGGPPTPSVRFRSACPTPKRVPPRCHSASGHIQHGSRISLHEVDVEHDDEVERLPWFVRLDICHLIRDRHVLSEEPCFLDRDGGEVDTSDGPSSLGKPQRVPSFTARNVESGPDGQSIDKRRQESVRACTPHQFGLCVSIIPVRAVHQLQDTTSR